MQTSTEIKELRAEKEARDRRYEVLRLQERERVQLQAHQDAKTLSDKQRLEARLRERDEDVRNRDEDICSWGTRAGWDAYHTCTCEGSGTPKYLPTKLMSFPFLNYHQWENAKNLPGGDVSINSAGNILRSECTSRGCTTT